MTFLTLVFSAIVVKQIATARSSMKQPMSMVRKIKTEDLIRQQNNNITTL